jgi:UDP-N-acetylmuramate--alanine ligase
VSGSDIADSAATKRLKSLGAKVHIGHADSNVSGANAVVTSTAVKPDNPEVAPRAQGVSR